MADAENHDSVSTPKDDKPAVLIVGGLGVFLITEFFKLPIPFKADTKPPSQATLVVS